MHELVVGHALAARGSIDPRNPELAHITLTRSAIAVGVLEGVKHRFIGGAEEGAMCHPEALGELEDLCVAVLRGHAAVYSWHLTLCPSDRARPAVADSH